MPDSARSRAEARFITARNNPRVLTDHDKEILVLLEAAIINLATNIEQFIPEGRLKSLALRNLEESLTWANKAIYIDGAITPALNGEQTDHRFAYVGNERGNIVYVIDYMHDTITFISDVPEPEPQAMPATDFFAKYHRAPEFD